MTISFDVDGVLIDSPYVDTKNPKALEEWIKNVDSYPIRFPESAPDIARWRRSGHCVVAVSARAPEMFYVTQRSLRPLGLSKVLCVGGVKGDLLKWMNPIIHFDDNPRFTESANRVRVWAPSWGQNVDGFVEKWSEIRSIVDTVLAKFSVVGCAGRNV